MRDRTAYDVMDELEVDFRDLSVYLNGINDLKDGDLKAIVLDLIHDYMIPQLKELYNLVDSEGAKK